MQNWKLFSQESPNSSPSTSKWELCNLRPALGLYHTGRFYPDQRSTFGLYHSGELPSLVRNLPSGFSPIRQGPFFKSLHLLSSPHYTSKYFCLFKILLFPWVICNHMWNYSEPGRVRIQISEFLLWWKCIQLVSMRIWVWSLALLSGSGIRCCHELWCRSQTGLGSSITVTVA